MFTKILVPLDGSQVAEHALPYAAELGRRFSASLELLEVLPPLVIDNHGPTPGDTYLVRLARDLREGGLDCVSCERVSNFSPAEAILTRSREHDLDLIVLTSRGRTGGERWLFGSTATQVMRHASCPALLIPARIAVHEPSLARILVPLDGSAASECALEFAVPLARKFGSRLSLLQVYGVAQERETTHNYLIEVAQNTPYPTTLDYRLGRPEDVVPERARAHDLTVMTSRGRGELSNWLVASVAERVCRNSPTPTLVINRDAILARRARRELADSLRESFSVTCLRQYPEISGPKQR